MQFSNICPELTCSAGSRMKGEKSMTESHFEWLPLVADAAAWTLRETAPDGDRITLYDQEHFLPYARLIDADQLGHQWREGASEILICDVELEHERPHSSWEMQRPRAHRVGKG